MDEAALVELRPPGASVPLTRRQAASFSSDLPSTVAEFYDFPVIGERLEKAQVAERTDKWLADLPGDVTSSSVRDAVDRVLAAATGVVQVVLLALAFLLDGEVLVRRARSVLPSRVRPTADRAATIVYDTLGRYFAGSLLLATLNGVYILGVGLVLGVPLVLLAAVWVAITNLIPQIGGFLGGSVFVVLALTQGAGTGAIALVLFMAYMSTENYLIQPAVVGRAVDLSPPTTMIAAIIGGTAAGVPGALVATPAVGSMKALYLAFHHPEPDQVPSKADER